MAQTAIRKIKSKMKRRDVCSACEGNEECVKIYSYNTYNSKGKFRWDENIKLGVKKLGCDGLD